MFDAELASQARFTSPATAVPANVAISESINSRLMNARDRQLPFCVCLTVGHMPDSLQRRLPPTPKITACPIMTSLSRFSGQRESYGVGTSRTFEGGGGP